MADAKSDEMWAAFHQFNLNRDNQLSVRELAKGLQQQHPLNETQAIQLAEDVVQKFQFDRTGGFTLDFDGFVEAWTQLQGVQRRMAAGENVDPSNLAGLNKKQSLSRYGFRKQLRYNEQRNETALNQTNRRYGGPRERAQQSAFSGRKYRFQGEVDTGAEKAIVSFPGVEVHAWKALASKELRAEFDETTGDDVLSMQTVYNPLQATFENGKLVREVLENTGLWSMCCVFTKEMGADMEPGAPWWEDWKKNVFAAYKLNQKLYAVCKRDGTWGFAQSKEVQWLKMPTDSNDPSKPQAGHPLVGRDKHFCFEVINVETTGMKQNSWRHLIPEPHDGPIPPMGCPICEWSALDRDRWLAF